MGYIITGVVCLAIGAVWGAISMGLCVAMHNNSEYTIESENDKEDEKL